MGTSIRSLYGMSYKSFEIDHHINVPMSEVLEEFAHYIRSNDVKGYIEHIGTRSHPDDEDRFLTVLIYAEY